MKILIFGASGMIGHKMYMRLKSCGFDVYGTLHKDLSNYSKYPMFLAPNIIPLINVADFTSVQSLLQDIKPNVILNCVGITLRKVEIKDAEYCTTVNTEFPGVLKNWCLTNKAYLIHFSTDCVFNGKKDYYTEDSTPDATDTYGRTKAAGEVTGDGILTLRGSQLGSEVFFKTELFEWALMQRNSTIKGFTGAIYSGVTTNVMAELVHQIIGSEKRISGLYQVSSEPISKFELLNKINSVFKLQMSVIAEEIYATTKVLRSEKINSQMGFRCPSWDDMISNLLLDRQQNSDLYGGQ
ncbi:MAG: SDR family oxidoreductase [Bdellovibrionaceae bacterium]|nr:SDR family oxidoreductase [Pseudobdellovibrionaceae bacterium]